jgi:alanyl-tRNA synthetase
MFEMLGNWSFGDYFKKEAIEWGWEFLVKILGISPHRLYATIFEGSPGENVPRDDEALKYWKACIGGDNGRIIEGSKKDNFWEMGETGPCGPCSEIHIDIRDDDERAKIPGHSLVNKGHPHVIEIWNLVFIQYNRKKDGSLELLPLKHVDTGMGFERLCMVMQGKKSNYDTDIFQSVISNISEITGKPYGTEMKYDVAMRVIADHLRAVSFAIADGQLPSNNKAGYVIRRILRRAVRYGYNNLGIEEPFIYKLVPVLGNVMGDQYPELNAKRDEISKIIFEEETTFLKTLGKGLKLIETILTGSNTLKTDVLPGDVAFRLYDTYGFPVDLTQLILKEKGMQVDINGFEKEMKTQKERSREDASTVTGDWIILRDTGGTLFTGYEKTEDVIHITRYRKVKVRGGDLYHLVVDRTPFYAESGGQVGDTGYLQSGSDKIIIKDTIKENALIVHIYDKLPSDPEAGMTAAVDVEKRLRTEANHTATHLIHMALRSVLGAHVEQKGSLVTPDRLRFDFSHYRKLTNEEINKVESIVNRIIREDHPRNVIDGISMKKAGEMGAIALFGEKYGEKVRVVGFGGSLELCGGTHVNRTGNIGIVKIISEGAVAAGVRRLEAVAGKAAEEYINERLSALDEIAAMLKSTGTVVESVRKLISENTSLMKTIEKSEARLVTDLVNNIQDKALIMNNIRFIAEQLESVSPEIMKNIAFRLRQRGDNTILVLGSANEGKASLVVMVTDDLIKARNISAVNIIKDISVTISGGGGGQPFLATAGGKNPDGIRNALKKAGEIIRELK